MEIIYTDKKIDNESVKQMLANLFPELMVFYYDFEGDVPRGMDYKNSDHISFTTSYNENKLEFVFVISIYRTPEENDEKRALYIAKTFSDFYEIRSLVPFTKPDEPKNPTYDIIFQKGKTFLANDSDTNFADSTEELVKIVGEYPLEEFKFDKKANYIKP